jgi:prepilin-type N-terminal cleavage/methylation domain-containing protein
MTRGMTLLEVLVSLTLLGVLSIAAAGLTQLAAGAGRDIARDERWQAAAEAVLDAIARDLETRDIDADPNAVYVSVDRGALRIQTRVFGTAEGSPPGPVRHDYRLDKSTSTLWRDHHTERGRQHASQDRIVPSRPLVGMVAGWTVHLDPETLVLGVTITGSDGQTVERRLTTR